nr:uncharacterized protein CI109_006091 [Kwoniella shandongensis]KAA5525518.1 hypothetical protein CI109_006091 [Kwoniella shandongensis]
MGRTLPTRQQAIKRRRSPSPSPAASSSSSSSDSEEVTTPPSSPPTKKSRKSKTITSFSSKKMAAKRKSLSRKRNDADEGGDDDSRMSSSDNSSVRTKPKRRRKTIQPDESKRNLLTRLGLADESALEDLLSLIHAKNNDRKTASSNSSPNKDGMKAEPLQEDEEQEEESEDLDEEEEFDEEERKELLEQAGIMAASLAAPFANSRTAFVQQYTVDLEALTTALTTAMTPFKGETMALQTQIWRKAQREMVTVAVEDWQKCAERLVELKKQMLAIYVKIEAVHKEKQRLVAQAKTAWQKALARQETEIEKLEEEALRSKDNFRAKLVKATDPARIQKEINMSFQKVLAERNA